LAGAAGGRRGGLIALEENPWHFESRQLRAGLGSGRAGAWSFRSSGCSLRCRGAATALGKGCGRDRLERRGREGNRI
jgi:hypothetical protein